SHRFNEARPGANDAGLLGLNSHHEAGDILHKEQRSSMTIAGLYEVGCFFGAIRIDDSAKLRRLPCGRRDKTAAVREQTHRHSGDPRMSSDQLACVPGLKFLEVTP